MRRGQRKQLSGGGIEQYGGNSNTTPIAYLITNEVPAGAINNANRIFTTANNYRSGTLQVYLNGVLQVLGVDYTQTSSNTFTFTKAPLAGPPADTVVVSYIKL